MDWSGHINSPPDLVIETDACPQRLGVQQSEDRRPLVSERKTSAHQLSWTTCRRFCSEMFHKELDLFACSTQNGQYYCLCMQKQTRRDPLLSIVQSSCRSWELCTREGHASWYRTFSREVEYPSRSGVETPTNGVCFPLQNLQFQLGTNWLNTSIKHEESWNTQHNFQPQIWQNYFFAWKFRAQAISKVL